MPPGRSFAATERFIREAADGKLKPAYVLLGDESFLRQRCLTALIDLIPPSSRDFGVHRLDLSETPLEHILDRARTPSLMAPFQVLIVGNLKVLFGRSPKKEEFAALSAYCANPNPGAVLVFVADHVSIPADARKIDLTAKDRCEKIRDVMGETCGIVELARVDEEDCAHWVVESAAARQVAIDADTARELVDAVGADMMLITGELEKLLLYTGDKKRIGLDDLELLVLGAKQRSLYDLTSAISSKDKARALAVLDALLASGDGEDAAIGHIYMLARTFRQLLVILEKNVRDSRSIWQALWPGFRIPPFAADDLIRQARRYKSRRELVYALRRIARADLALRSSPVSKRLVLEQLVLDLTRDAASGSRPWHEEQLA